MPTMPTMPTLYPQVSVHPSEHPQASSAALLNALKEHRLPGKWLYNSLAQSSRWLAYHQAWSPSRMDALVAARYREAFAVAVRKFATDHVHIIGLGCGGGQKDNDLLAALRERPSYGGTGKRYTPVDASLALVLEAAGQTARRHPQVEIHPLLADLETSPDLAGWLEALEPPRTGRLATCFGMIPNLDPKRFPAWLAGFLRMEDRLLFSANLSPGGLEADGERILRQYDNPPARQWYLGALESLGIKTDHVNLDISAESLPAVVDSVAGGESGKVWRIRAVATPKAPLAVEVFGEAVKFDTVNPLEVFTSNRFDQESVTKLLENAGLAVEQTWDGANGEEGIFLCRKAT